MRIGDDAWIEDFNVANAIKIKGNQNNANGYIAFGSQNDLLGRAGTGALTWAGNTIWTAGNDGSGSGLDADLLDGKHATDFVAVTGDAMTGALTINGGSATYALSVDGAITTDQYIAFLGSGVNSSPDMTIGVSNNVMTFSDVSGSGYADFNVDSIRGELYYDRDNTSYYLNPASTSVLNTLNTNGGDITATHFGIANSSSGSRDGIALYGGATGGEPTYGLLFTGTSLGTHGGVTGNWATYFTMNNDTSRGWIFRRVGSGNSASISAGGLATFDNSVRTPIFYDSNDTTYYIDPNSTSRSARLRGEILIGPNTSSKYLKLGGDGGGTTYSTISTSNGNLHIDSTSGFATYINHYAPGDVLVGNGGGYLHVYNSVRSPIFYDLNDTSYYTDPASTSYLAYLGRRAHNTGHLVGSYNNVGANGSQSNPIYTIGSSYNPSTTTLSSMYGIGYSHTNASFISFTGASGWGMYVAADGNARVWLDGGSGRISAKGNIYAPVYYDYNNTAYYLDPGNSSVSAKFAGSVEAVSTIGNLTSGSLGQQMEKGSTSVTTLRFDADRWRLYAGAGSGEVVTVQQGGNVGIGTTSPSQKLDVVGSIEVSDGVYIGGTAAANKLDDYEEGTFAPTITATGTDTGVSGNGQYTKIGNQVHVEIRITKFLDEDDSCAIQSVTLPFTAKATSNVNYKGNVFMFTGNIVNQYARLQEGTNSLTLYDPGLRLSLSPDETNEIGISITYLT